MHNAAVALARAALEDHLRNRLAKFYGKKAVADADLEGLIEDFAPKGNLSREGQRLANIVRREGNDVLHRRVTALPDALRVIEATRCVILELSKR